MNIHYDVDLFRQTFHTGIVLYPTDARASLISSSTKARAMTCCFALLSLIFGLCSSSFAQSDLTSKKVLILHSYEVNTPVFVRTDSGLSAQLQSGGIPSLNQFYESLDLRRNPLGLPLRRGRYRLENGRRPTCRSGGRRRWRCGRGASGALWTG